MNKSLSQSLAKLEGSDAQMHSIQADTFAPRNARICR